MSKRIRIGLTLLLITFTSSLIVMACLYKPNRKVDDTFDYIENTAKNIFDNGWKIDTIIIDGEKFRKNDDYCVYHLGAGDSKSALTVSIKTSGETVTITGDASKSYCVAVLESNIRKVICVVFEK